MAPLEMMRSRSGAAGVVVAAVALSALFGCTPAADQAAGADIDVPEPFLVDADFADPDVLAVGGGYLAYATQSESANVQIAISSDLLTWSLLDDDAFPDLPAWAIPGDTWAPEVTAWADGYLLFHTSTDLGSGNQCIGLATAFSPLGPFIAATSQAIVCPPDGAIDASFFIDADGAPYLLWKVDGNCCGGRGSIWLSALDSTALDRAVEMPPALIGGVLLGEPVQILGTDELWEDDVVEAPTLIRRPDGQYVLFYSGGSYNGLDYAIGWASSAAITGPFSKASEPMLSTESSDFAFIGPGGQDVAGDVLLFHSWDSLHEYRGLQSAELEWDGDVPRVVLPRLPD